MLMKVLVLALATAGIARIVFGSRLEKIRKWAGQVLDTTLIVLGLLLVVQMVLLATKT